MNVLHISTPKSWRGGEQQLAYLAKELNPKLGKQIIACRQGGAMEKYAHFAQLTTFPIKGGLLRLYGNAMNIKKICRKEKIDLIHVHDSKAHTIAYLSTRLGNKTPVIVSRRVDFPVSNNPLSRRKYNHRSIKKFICVSRKIMEITGEAVQDKSKLTVIYDGIDIEQLKQIRPLDLHREFDIPEHYSIVGNIAALAPHKDYFTWVDTAEILCMQNRKIRFLIVGEGPLCEEIEEYINAKGMEDDITMTGFRKDAKAILASLDVLLVSSETEGLGSSILDAFACKVPVVATEAGGIPEIVHHKETGLLAPVKASERLAELTGKMLDNKSLRKETTSRASEFVCQFDKKNMAAQTYEVYKGVSSIQ